jgi:hypothetical protein
LAGEQHDSLSITVQTLKKRLHERKLLVSTERASSRGTLTIRRTVEGRQHQVLYLRADALVAGGSTNAIATDELLMGAQVEARTSR